MLTPLRSSMSPLATSSEPGVDVVPGPAARYFMNSPEPSSPQSSMKPAPSRRW